MLKADSYHLVYPKMAIDMHLSTLPITPIAVLVDSLSLASRSQDIRLIQALSKLERVQLQIASIRMLNTEEDRVLDVDDFGLMRTTVEQGTLGPALVKLEMGVKDFANYIAALPSDDLQHDDFKKYGFLAMIVVLDGIVESERNKAKIFQLCNI